MASSWITGLFSSQKKADLLSIALNSQAIIAHYHPIKGDSQQYHLPIVNDNLNNCVQELRQQLPNKVTAQLVLSSQYYQIVQVEQPNIPENELIDALKWQVKDLVSFSPSDMILDYFTGPMVSGKQKLNVVCAQQSKLKALVDKFHADNIQLNMITTEEFGFAQLLADKSDAQLLICQQPNEEILILIVKDGQLSSFRRLRGYRQISQRSEEELSFGMTDSLSIEIQKSIDFYERQLKQAPVKVIQVLLPMANEAFLARKLAENTHLPVELLAFPEGYPTERTHGAVIGSIFAERYIKEKDTSIEKKPELVS